MQLETINYVILSIWVKSIYLELNTYIRKCVPRAKHNCSQMTRQISLYLSSNCLRSLNVEHFSIKAWFWVGLKEMVPSIVHTLWTLPCPVSRRYFRMLCLYWVRSSCNENGLFFFFNTTFLQYLDFDVVSRKLHDNWPRCGTSLPNSMRSAHVTRGDM